MKAGRTRPPHPVGRREIDALLAQGVDAARDLRHSTERPVPAPSTDDDELAPARPCFAECERPSTTCGRAERNQPSNSAGDELTS